MTIHALWCHPRSVSTAFERIMRQRGDLTVLHEPFMYDYYIGAGNKPFENFEPEPGHPTDYTGVRDMILRLGEAGPVFFKDMAYYVQDKLPADPEFMGAMSHAILVRDPAESILSYHRKDPGFACEEVGIEGLWRLYEQLRAAGLKPVVIHSAALRADPAGQMARYWKAVGLKDCPEALSWNTDVPEGWKSVEAWHAEVLSSTGIKPAEDRDYRAELAALGAPYTGYDAHHRPFYDLLCQAADEDAHQK